MFFEQAGPPNWYEDNWRYYGGGGDEERRTYKEHPGVGEYMCFDPLMLADLEEHAQKLGHDAWYASFPSPCSHDSFLRNSLV
jgi:hypothetical protein